MQSLFRVGACYRSVHMKRLHIWRTGIRWLGLGAILILLVSAYTPLWNDVADRLVVEPKLQPADAIVVLGAGVLSDGTLVNESLRRAVHGIELFKRGLAPTLVFCGPPWQLGGSPTEADARNSLAVRIGVPEDRILAVG